MARNRTDGLLDRLDRHLETARDGGADAEPTPDLVEEVRERFRRAQVTVDVKPRANAVYAGVLRSMFPETTRSVTHFTGVVVFFVIGLGMIAIGLGRVFVFVFWGVSLILLLTTNRLNRRKNKVIPAIVLRRCAACGYSVEGVNAIPADRLGGIEVGPALCPECAYRWPRVPPDVPAPPPTHEEVCAGKVQ